MKYIEDGYSGKGWNHQDPSLGDIYWPIEEATWLRITYDKTVLSKETKKFLAFLENKKEFNSEYATLDDLIKFQMFLLTTRDEKKETKSDEFGFNWKNFFVNNEELINSKTNYNYKNLVLEENEILWGFKTIFYGRTSKKYKFHPEFLQQGRSKSELVQTV